MRHHFFVKLGALTEVHPIEAPAKLSRGQRVLVRTPRGVELAEVAGESARPWANSADAVAGTSPERPAVQFLRQTTAEDELLIKRLDQHKREAVEACREALIEAGSISILLEVDLLFDGGTLLLHFLGPADSIAESATREIVERYESIVRAREFAQLLNAGCGPDCGTAESSGCGSGCGGCAVAVACHGGSAASG